MKLINHDEHTMICKQREKYNNCSSNPQYLICQFNFKFLVLRYNHCVTYGSQLDFIHEILGDRCSLENINDLEYRRGIVLDDYFKRIRDKDFNLEEIVTEVLFDYYDNAGKHYALTKTHSFVDNYEFLISDKYEEEYQESYKFINQMKTDDIIPDVTKEYLQGQLQSLVSSNHINTNSKYSRSATIEQLTNLIKEMADEEC